MNIRVRVVIEMMNMMDLGCLWMMMKVEGDDLMIWR
jgi:hypothetical protein